MKAVTLSVGNVPYVLTAWIIFCGSDIVVVVGGSEKPHVGAVAMATPRTSLKDATKISASASVICGVGHKDDLPAREAALCLASRLNTNVAVSVGLHLDDASADDIALLKKNFVELIEKIATTILDANI